MCSAMEADCRARLAVHSAKANECSQFSREKARAEADGTKRFEFDYVFEPTTSQDEVFNTMGRPVLKVGLHSWPPRSK